MAEELPPAILDLIVNTAQWIEGLQASIGSLEELDAAITDTSAMVDEFGAAVTAAAGEAAAAMEEAAASIAGASDEAAASLDRLAAAADTSSASVDAAGSKMTAASGEMSAASGELGIFGDVASTVGDVLQKAAEGTAVIGTASLWAAGDFQKAMTQLVTSAGESQGAIGLVGQGLQDMATQVGFSAIQLAKAMYPIDSATYHAADSLTIMKAAAEGAKDENADLTITASALTTVMRDYKIPVDDAANTMSKMITAVSFGKTTLQDFSKAMANLLPVAQSAGLKFADVASVFAEMTSKGTPAAKAALDIQNAIRSLEAPTNGMIKQFKEFGTSAQEVQRHLDQDGLGGTLNWLQGLAEKNAQTMGETVTGAMKKLIGTAPGLQSMLEISGGSFRDVQTAMTAVNGAMADAQGNVVGFTDVQGNLNFTFDQFKAELENVAISIGNVMMPSAMRLFKMLEEGFQELGKNTDLGDAFKSIMDTIGEAVKALVPLVKPLISTFKDLVQIAGPLLVDALKLIAPSLAVNIQAFDDMLKSVKPLLPLFDQMSKVVGAGLGTDFQQIWNVFKLVLPEMTKFFAVSVQGFLDLVKVTADFMRFTKEFGDWINSLPQKLSDTATAIGRWITDLPDKIGKAIGDVGGFISNQWNKAMDGLKGEAQNSIKATIDTFTNLPQKVGYAIGNLAGTILRESANAGKNLEKGIKDGATAVVKFFEVDLPKDIQTAVSDAEKWLNTAGKQILKGLLDGVEDAMGAVEKWFNDLPNVIKGWVHDAYSWLVKTGRDLIQGLIDSVIGKLGDIGKAMTGGHGSVKGAVTDPFNDAISWLVNAGRDIITGIWHGITGGWNWLMGQIQAFASSIKQGFMDALGINSPSKVMADTVGLGIVEGIALGMTSNSHLLRNAVSSIQGTLTTGLSPIGVTPAGLGLPTGAAGLATAGAGGSVLVINNNVQGSVVAEQQLQQLVQTQSLRYNYRNPTNGLSLFGRGAT